MGTAEWALERVTPHIGAEVTGSDPENVGEQGFRYLEEALVNYKVLFFRDAWISHAVLNRLASHFGEPPAAHHVGSVPGFPAIALVRSTAERTQLSNYWHSDGSYLPAPPSVTLLRAVEVPPTGGDTLG